MVHLTDTKFTNENIVELFHENTILKPYFGFGKINSKSWQNEKNSNP
jgi:hypothetical protein